MEDRQISRVRKGCATCRWFAVCATGGATGQWYKCARCGAHWHFLRDESYDGFLGVRRTLYSIGVRRTLYSIHCENDMPKQHSYYRRGVAGGMDMCPKCMNKLTGVQDVVFYDHDEVEWELGAQGAVLCARFVIHVFLGEARGCYYVMQIL